MSDFNLGTVTAYGYAKDKGYTGTEAEFAELMASYASVAESAAASAESAAASATTATTKAGEASTSASNAATSATTASTAATTATTKAGEASTSASTASTKASEATTAAATATTKAGEASTSATNAAGSATTASTAATTATTKASEAAASATAAAQSAASLVIDDTLTHAGQAADAKKVGDELSDVKDGLTAVESDVTDLKEDYTTILESAYVTDTASGAIASFPDGADGVPVKSLTVAIEPVQAGTGDPSPTNIRPISGHTHAVVTRCGKNLLNRDTEEDGFINADGGIQTDGVSVHSALMAVTEEEKYTFSGIASTTAGTGNKRIHGYDVNGNWVRQLSYLPIEIGRPYAITVTIPNGIKYVRVSHYSADTECLFEKSEIATAYEPYTAQTVTIDLGGTVYGGTLDVTTGVLTVDSKELTINSSDGFELYNIGSNTTVFRKPNAVNENITENGEISNILKFHVSAYKAQDGRENTFILGASKSLFIQMPNTVASTIAELNTFISSNPVTVVYKLATPQTIQLSAQEVRTLLGTNNVFADCGDVNVEYRADTKLYIEKLTAPTEDDMVADANIVSGQYFMVGNTLYKATANIASGGAITPNVNCTRKSLPEALNEINA